MSTNDPLPEGTTPPPPEVPSSPWQAPTQPTSPSGQSQGAPQPPPQGTPYGQAPYGQAPYGQASPGPVPGHVPGRPGAIPGQAFPPPPGTFNGAPMVGTMPPAKKSPVGLIIALAVGFVVVLAVIALISYFLSPGRSTSTSSPSRSSSPSSSSASVGSGEAITINETITAGDWSLNVESYTPDATEAMADPKLSNDPAPSGTVYALVKVRITYTGSDAAGEDYVFNHFKLKTSKGDFINWTSSMALAPDDLFNHFDTTLKPGASQSGNLLFEVPIGEEVTFVFTSDDRVSAEVLLG